MNEMLLKGYNKQDKEVTFTVNDCPVVLTSSTIVLVANMYGHIIYSKTIVRGFEDGKIYEGDIVEDSDGDKGIVVYSKGLCIQKEDKTLKKLRNLNHIKVSKGDIESIKEIVKCEQRTPISFGYKDKFYDFNNFLYKNGNMIGLVGSDKLINPKDLAMYTGWTLPDSKKMIYFGGLYNGGVVVLHDGSVCLKYNEDEFVEIETILAGGKK